MKEESKTPMSTTGIIMSILFGAILLSVPVYFITDDSELRDTIRVVTIIITIIMVVIQRIAASRP